MQGFRSFGYHEKRAVFAARQEEDADDDEKKARSDSSNKAAALPKRHNKRRRKTEGAPAPPSPQLAESKQDLSPPIFQNIFDDSASS